MIKRIGLPRAVVLAAGTASVATPVFPQRVVAYGAGTRTKPGPSYPCTNQGQPSSFMQLPSPSPALRPAMGSPVADEDSTSLRLRLRGGGDDESERGCIAGL